MAGLTAEQVALVHTNGILQDVGKIGVPDAILKKTGRLEAEERRVMETHPALGKVIVRKAHKRVASLPGARHYYERWNGKGCPDGLQGEQVPYPAHIPALADTFDAMTPARTAKGCPGRWRGAGT